MAPSDQQQGTSSEECQLSHDRSRPRRKGPRGCRGSPGCEFFHETANRCGSSDCRDKYSHGTCRTPTTVGPGYSDRTARVSQLASERRPVRGPGVSATSQASLRLTKLRKASAAFWSPTSSAHQRTGPVRWALRIAAPMRGRETRHGQGLRLFLIGDGEGDRGTALHDVHPAELAVPDRELPGPVPRGAHVLHMLGRRPAASAAPRAGGGIARPTAAGGPCRVPRAWVPGGDWGTGWWPSTRRIAPRTRSRKMLDRCAPKV